tara:strand:+ start:4461 stop:5213 length:753 start_codon:yes stop_codon:yes gene_type:complete
MKNNNYFCNNCGKTGHLFNDCKMPITSIGVICIKILPNKQPEYLLIRRKDSFGYSDFIRGKYPIYNENYIVNLINEMTLEEKEQLLEQHTKAYNESDFNLLYFKKMYSYFKSYDINYLKSLIEKSITRWSETEWGFPKGRRNFQEKDLDCALREFEEETGMNKDNMVILENVIPYEEIFTGSNHKSYKHKYFIALMFDDIPISENYQKSEVSKVSWKTFEETIKLLRPYNLEKIDMLSKVNKIWSNFILI